MTRTANVWPAIDVRPVSADLILAIVDEFSPTAIEERGDAIRVFFARSDHRDAAGAALSAADYSVHPVEVDDEDWARRSQENLEPVTVGRITVAPPASCTWGPPLGGPIRLKPDPTGGPIRLKPSLDKLGTALSNVEGPDPTGFEAGLKSCATTPLTIVIQPSMGFGTGHHATTRLCLRALQTLDLTNRLVLDVGTGSGVLAFAAVRLGAARAVGIDHDADAIQAANENLTLNSPWCNSIVAPRTARRPAGKARRPRISGIFEGGATQPAGMHRRSNADGVAPRAVNPGVRSVEFQVADLSTALLPEADVVIANLTGAFLIRSAGLLWSLVRPGGTLIVSGLLEEEREDVGRTLLGPPVWEQHEEGWVALAMKRS